MKKRGESKKMMQAEMAAMKKGGAGKKVMAHEKKEGMMGYKSGGKVKKSSC